MVKRLETRAIVASLPSPETVGLCPDDCINSLGRFA